MRCGDFVAAAACAIRRRSRRSYLPDGLTVSFTLETPSRRFSTRYWEPGFETTAAPFACASYPLG